ncbi:MAG: hypothetical protein AAF721_36660, partial [Myxococcota bacterium]
EQLRALEERVAEWAPTTGGEAAATLFEQRFWGEVAGIGGNKIFRLEVGWWYRVFAAQHPRPPAVAAAPLSVRIDFYRELARRMSAQQDAVSYYRATVAPILSMLDG